MSGRYEPYYKRNPRELSDYITKVNDAIKGRDADRAASLLNYKSFKHMLRKNPFGGSKPLPELFKAIGIKFDFSEKMLKKLLNKVNKELKSLLEELNETKDVNN